MRRGPGRLASFLRRQRRHLASFFARLPFAGFVGRRYAAWRASRKRLTPFAAAMSALTTVLLVLSGGMVAYSPFYPNATPPPSAIGVPGSKTPGERNLPPGSPVRLVVPSVGIDAPVVPIPLLNNGALEPPEDYREVGYWDGSARPGFPFGQTVITGHTVHYGGGAMDHIGDVKDGAAVDVLTQKGDLSYRVTGVDVMSKADLTKNAVEIFGQDPAIASHQGRLVLVTCTDYNGYEYLSNVVVYAQLVDSSRTSDA